MKIISCESWGHSFIRFVSCARSYGLFSFLSSLPPNMHLLVSCAPRALLICFYETRPTNAVFYGKKEWTKWIKTVRAVPDRAQQLTRIWQRLNYWSHKIWFLMKAPSKLSLCLGTSQLQSAHPLPKSTSWTSNSPGKSHAPFFTVEHKMLSNNKIQRF